MRKMKRVIQPRTIIVYRLNVRACRDMRADLTYHPMFELLVQHGRSPDEQVGRSPQEYLGIRPYDMTDATTTPIGCRVSNDSREQMRFSPGRYSRQRARTACFWAKTPK